MTLSPIYAQNMATLTDLYQITMARGYLESGFQDHEAVFHMFFRKLPEKGGYAVFSGLQQVVEFLESFHFDDSDCQYLSELEGTDGKPLFDQRFLRFLAQMRFSCDVSAPAEGTIVFPHEPLLRISGPLIQCQLIETALLNIINFQTLIATKSARIVEAAEGDPVLEFGLRRAQGFDGALSASRAAYLGGCSATSNVLAGKLFGMPVKGTHAHSWVMSFSDELEAFTAYARAMPHNCIFLVDTFDTLAGVGKAVQVALEMRDRGAEMIGIRLDSGDLVALSREARTMLNEAGFSEARIVASNDLDEYTITDLKRKGAAIDMWGVGTRLVTAFDQPALGGVYKLAAIREPGGPWQARLKRSEDPIKASIPGFQNVRRYFKADKPVADLIYHPENKEARGHVPIGAHRMEALPEHDRCEELLKPVMVRGEVVMPPEPLHVIRARVLRGIASLDAEHKRLEDPRRYPVSLHPDLHEQRDAMLCKVSVP